MPDEVSYTEEEISAVWQQRYANLRDVRRRITSADAQQIRTNNAKRYVVVRSGTKRFAFSLKRVAEVLPMTARQTGTPVPGSSPAFWGLLLVRGEVRPVFDIKYLLGVSDSEIEGEGHILFVHGSDNIRETATIAGFKVDRVEQILLLPEPGLAGMPAPPALPGRFVLRLHEENAETAPIQVVDVSALLASLRGDSEPEPALSERDNLSISTDGTPVARVGEE